MSETKRCSSGEKCKSFNGPIQSRNSFAKNRSQADGLNSTCRECKSYKVVYRRANLEKRKHIDYFRSLSVSTEREKYIFELYTKQDRTMQYVKSITLMPFQNIVELIIGKFQIQKCLNGDNCVNGDPIQTVNSFGKDKSRPTGLSTFCKSCVKRRIRSQETERLQQKSIREFAKFDAFDHQISYAEDTRRDPDNPDLLYVRCYNHKCTKWYNPTVLQVRNRVIALEGQGRSISTTCNFYCSQGCKDDCPVFGVKIRKPISHNVDYQRIQATVRRFKINMNGEPSYCEICNRTIDSSGLILHHKYPVVIYRMFEADLDNLIWVCDECHKKAHQKDGCTYHELSEPLSSC